jgi:myo-inositol catabolism protein IolS
VDYRPLGQTNLKVSTVSMGGMGIAGMWGPQDDADTRAALRAAVEEGINFFDTAEGYAGGRSEQLLGQTLKGQRHEVIIASKVLPEHLSAPELTAACERSLKNLGTDYLDLFYIHWPNPQVPMAESAAALVALRNCGKIRHIAVSNFGPQDFSDFLQLARPEANQLPYSLLWRAVEYQVEGLCQSHQVSIVAYSPLMHGLLTGKYFSADELGEGRTRSRLFRKDRPGSRHGEDGHEELTFAVLARLRKICADAGLKMEEAAVAWLLERPGVSSVIVGARNAKQARSAAAMNELKLDPAVSLALTAATDELKAVMGPTLDMWQAPSVSRIR